MQSIAQALGCPAVDWSTRQHQPAFDGCCIPLNVAVLLVFLSSFELRADSTSIPRPPATLNGFKALQVPQNGRCFMTALHLFTQISKQPRHADEWEGILRSHTGMPMSQQTGHVDVKRLKHEETCTLDTLEQRYIYICTRVYSYIYIYVYMCVA